MTALLKQLLKDKEMVVFVRKQFLKGEEMLVCIETATKRQGNGIFYLKTAS